MRFALRHLSAVVLFGGLSVSLSCERPDLNAALACDIFRETVCQRVEACGELDAGECASVVFADAPSCATVLSAEGDLEGCNEQLATMPCDELVGFSATADLPSDGPCAQVRYVFPR